MDEIDVLRIGLNIASEAFKRRRTKTPAEFMAEVGGPDYSEVPKVSSYTPRPVGASTSHSVVTVTQPAAVSQPSGIQLASTAETVAELKRRLGKELYKIELDLMNGGRINGKPCDCLDSKHHFGVEAAAEEMMSYDHNPVYGQVIAWYNEQAPSFTPEAIAGHDVEYYRAMIPTVRAFRKEVMGTENLSALLTAEQLAKVAAKPKKMNEHGA